MLLRHRLPADLLTPLSAYLACAAHDSGVLLESADAGERVGRYSFVLMQPSAEFICSAEETKAAGWPAALRELAGPRLCGAGELSEGSALPEGREPMPLGVGLCGYVGFEALAAMEPSLQSPPAPHPALPTVWVKRFDAALVFDHLHQVAELQVRAATREAAAKRLTACLAALAQPVHADEHVGAPKAEAHTSAAAYMRAVRTVQDLIRDGDVYQLVLSQRLTVSDPPSPLTAYRRMRRSNPSPYGYLLQWGDFALAGASPETLVRVVGTPGALRAEVIPIAGTVPRSGMEATDAARFEALKRDEKELAEHQMLVDLARNDLGRLAVPGGVQVSQPLALQRTSHVLHLTTTVTAQLQSGCDALDVLASCFPAGTVSGAPKIRAVQRIAELEGQARGPYGGALIRLSACGALDTALILRSAVYAGGKASLQAGAGIVRASLPDKEYLETLHKLGAPAAALGVDLSTLLAQVQLSDGEPGQ